MERANLTVRMHLRTLARLRNGFRKLIKILAALPLFVAWCDFALAHQTLRAAPAMEAGLTDHTWTFHELLAA